MVRVTLPLLLIGLPAFCVVAWVVLLVRGQRTGLLISVLMCGITFAAGYWSIRHSRGSTSGLGFLFLPGLGGLSGLLAALFARLRKDPQRETRAAAWLCLLASMGVVLLYLVGGIQEQRKNDGRDRQQAQAQDAIHGNRMRIARLIQENPGHESAALDAEIDKHLGDRNFLIPALETAFVSEDRLDQLSTHDDSFVVLSVTRNAHARSDTLVKIYIKSSHPTYFFQALPEFQALAENKNTPVDILKTLAARPEARGSLDRWFAGNPSAPHDVLDRIADSGDVHMLRSLLANAALDCGLLRKAAARLGPADRNEVRSTDAAIASLEARLCVAK
jgi:hypothetical protein